MTDTLGPCRKCGSRTLSTHPVLHHFICAYVGPSYDFSPGERGALCPKCKRYLTLQGTDWEIVGDSNLCKDCEDERML